jgi:hypothetical protein
LDVSGFLGTRLQNYIRREGSIIFKKEIGPFFFSNDDGAIDFRGLPSGSAPNVAPIM